MQRRGSRSGRSWEEPVINAPQTLGLVGEKYHLAERLGEGAAGTVYRAVHVGLEKSFAIKLLKASGAPAPAALERFRTEALALGRLRHPNIVEVTDCGIDGSEGGLPYIVTELLEGVPLSGPLPLAQALPLLEQISGAIDAAHGAGVLHRDLKPGNVFVCAAGPVKVLDFGLAELLAGPDRTGGACEEIGTPLYAAPELIRTGEASRASDIYSFGVLAYELLGGRPPFQGSVAEVLAGHLEAEPPPLPLPPEVWHALRDTLEKDPALRPRSAGEVVRRLRKGAAQAEWARWKAVEIPRRMRIAALLAAILAAVGLLLPWPPLPGLERPACQRRRSPPGGRRGHPREGGRTGSILPCIPLHASLDPIYIAWMWRSDLPLVGGALWRTGMDGAFWALCLLALAAGAATVAAFRRLGRTVDTERAQEG